MDPARLGLSQSQARRMRRTWMACAGVAFGMIGLAYAAVPLYDLFCRMTGFGGTPMVRSAPSSQVLDHAIAVRFDANVAPGLDWRFAPEAAQVELKLGETRTVFYRVRNAGPAPATGIASFNVQPALAGAYFVKVQCFCFTDQTLQPGESAEFPVVFYVDPGLAQDPNVKDLGTITLSYTFFAAKGAAPVATSSAAPAKPNL
jgi:cytochrome c oxidase assembly protein subunit 11